MKIIIMALIYFIWKKLNLDKIFGIVNNFLNWFGKILS